MQFLRLNHKLKSQNWCIHASFLISIQFCVAGFKIYVTRNNYFYSKLDMTNKPPLNSPCCCGVSCWRRVILADRGWRSLRWWRAGRRKRWKWEPAAGTPFATQLPAAWGQHLETWEVCHLEGSQQTHKGIIMQRHPHKPVHADKDTHIHIQRKCSSAAINQFPTKRVCEAGTVQGFKPTNQINQNHQSPLSRPHSIEKEEGNRNHEQTTLQCVVTLLRTI